MKNREPHFCVPNQIFEIGLSPDELVTYLYLLRCQNIKTHLCWPSYSTIGQAIGRSKNSVMKYVSALIEKGLIYAEPTTIKTADGKNGNGALLYKGGARETGSSNHKAPQCGAFSNFWQGTPFEGDGTGLGGGKRKKTPIFKGLCRAVTKWR